MLRVPITSSPLMAAALVLMHGLAAACLLGYAPAWGWAFVGLAALTASLAFHLRRDALLLASNSVVELVLHEDGSCELLTHGGAELRGRIRDSSFVSPPLVAITARLDSGRFRHVILLPDSAPAKDRRRLRVWLRHAMRTKQTGSAGL